MALTTSNSLPLQGLAPKFNLPATNFNNNYTFEDIKGSLGTLVMFICNHCPYVIHAIDEIVMIANDYRVQGIGVVAISSNDSKAYPKDSPENMTEFAFNNNIDFPYLFDESQQTAKDYDAACTPEFYLFDAQDQLYYHGQLDDSRPGNDLSISGRDLRSAIDALIYNRYLNKEQKPSMGCNIKWRLY